jgi:hypothetical protein
MVYEKADRIIFTNENQLEYMLSYNPAKELEASIRERALILRQPMIDRRYVNFLPSGYEVPAGRINVGYFGNFYANRSHVDMLGLLANPDVLLHVFTAGYWENDFANVASDAESMGFDPARILVNDSVPYFEMLDIASKMDYLFLQDVNFAGPINPFIQSKYSDYLASGSRIIALVCEGSPLSMEEDERLIKTGRLTEEFALSLTARDAQGISGDRNGGQHG